MSHGILCLSVIHQCDFEHTMQVPVPQCPHCRVRKVNIVNLSGWCVGFEPRTVLEQSQLMGVFMTHRAFALGPLSLSLGLSYDGASSPTVDGQSSW